MRQTLQNFFSDRQFSRWLVPFLAAIMLLLLLILAWLMVARHRAEREAARIAEMNRTMDEKIEGQTRLIATLKDSAGRLIQVQRVIELDRNSARSLSEVQGTIINRQLRAITNSQKDFEKVLKGLKSTTSVSIDARGADFMALMQDTIIIDKRRFLTGDSIVRDTVKVFARSFKFSDPGGWFEIKGLVTNDTVNFSPIWRDRLTFATYRQRRPKKYLIDPVFLRRKQTVVRYKSENPYSNLREFTQINIDK